MSEKQSHTSVKQMNISNVPSSRYSLTLGNIMLLDDNIFNKSKGAIEGDGLIPIGKKYPYKQMFFLAIFCTEGFIRTSLNLQDYEVKDNDILVCFAGAIISDFRIAPGTQFFAIALSEEYFFNNNPSSCIRAIRENMIRPRLAQTDEAQMGIALSMYKMLREIVLVPDFEFKTEAARGLITTMATGLAQWLIKNPNKEDKTTLGQHEALFLDFLQAVHTHCHKERKITFYADLFGISPKYFSKIIYDISGKHAGDWIREHVTLEAKAMLNSGEKSVQEVSEALNFPNPSFFGKYFRTYTGYSPKQYSIKSRKG